MKVMWIGHGGLLFVSGKSKVIIDPYLSNSMSAIDGSLSRKLRIKHKLLRIKPNVLILTSSSPEHTDWKTLKKYFKKKRKDKISVLACKNTYEKIVVENEPFKKKVMKKITKKQKVFKSANHAVFAPGMEWSIGDLTIKAISAYTNDPTAFGVIITDRTDGKKYYVSGPTMYNEKLFDEIPDDLFAAFVPIGGEFGMMNNVDALRFAKRIDAEYVVPISYAMFNKRIKADEDFKVGGRVIPKAYRIIEFTLCPVQPLFNGGLDMFYNEKKPKKDKKALTEEETDVEALIAENEPITIPPVLESTQQYDAVKLDENGNVIIEAQATELETPEAVEEEVELSKEKTTEEEADENAEATTEEKVDEVGEATNEEKTVENAEAIAEVEANKNVEATTEVGEESNEDTEEKPTESKENTTKE